jgi:hypothetical protein
MNPGAFCLLDKFKVFVKVASLQISKPFLGFFSPVFADLVVNLLLIAAHAHQRDQAPKYLCSSYLIVSVLCH